MKIKQFVGVWFKYQFSLNWLNILFRYFVKLLLFINLVMVVVGVTYKFKSEISQFRFLISGLVLIDLFLKIKLKKNRQYLRGFIIIPNGLVFLSILNILQDFFSARNLILPLLTIGIATILGQPGTSIIYLFFVSCINNIVSGFANRGKEAIAIFSASMLILATSNFNLSTISIYTFLTLASLLLIYFRYGEKLYPKENTLRPLQINSVYSNGNHFLWLDFQIFKKSRHLQLTFVKVFAICLLYCYIISTRYMHQVEIEFGLIMLIQIYFSLAPAILIPYILGSNYSFIGLLMTLPDLKSFFIAKINIIVLFQCLLTLILFIANYNNVQILFLISSICIFNVFIITPIMFIGILLTDEKVNIFDSSINSFLFIPSFIQSIYFLLVLIGAAVILYLLQNVGVNYFSLTLIVLSSMAFSQKKRFFRFFRSQYYSKKYKLFKILS